MKLYRKKPVAVHAARLSVENFVEIIQWVETNKDEAMIDAMTVVQYPKYELHIQTLEGVMTAREGDWVVQGVHGWQQVEFIFAQLFHQPLFRSQFHDHYWSIK